MPIVTVPRALLSLLSLIVLAAAAYLLWRWFQGQDILGSDGIWRHERGPDWWLYTGMALLAWSFLGRFVVLAFTPGGKDEPREERVVGRDVQAPDGALIYVETFGRPNGPTLVLTHGWGLNSTAWWHAKRQLGERFRLVVWDLPGLGKSERPNDGAYSIDGFAQALGAVIDDLGDTRVVLLGHSIGGMITQTFFRACPDKIRRRVVGVVLVDTTYENPLRTMLFSRLWLALRRPLIEPMCWLTSALSPLIWLANWQGYLSGSSHIAMRLTGFGRHATRGQVDFTARLACKGSPAVQAKGNLAMFRWQAREVLPGIAAPALVLTGSRDIVTLPRASELISSEIPRAALTRFDGAGHMGFMECAEAYNEAIAAFADKAFRTTAAA